ncbi:2,3-bisphosphoglycerate-independent phosphoglycerate mutase [Petroclostridium sp. X23]|uniref:2,3-bisphosphoglycerate-independent phosphoglycerate mutase n=1 Tax=Petroclostridium sp. X23 TaxID=3045146 RepID=UPI0024AD22FA|nr:2,3-bisphosphoglycerate-independent phosphoglycerate mutase [Petroclostridium sp. X23]WHH60715.1 2,3-bisphosphoglycerate-independent phosphoglycerate mutase [Petroclostridium sp. X23]
MKDKLLMLVVLDGYGLNEMEKGNAIKAANTPNMDRFMKEYPNTIIHCSGLDVGLPEGQMGNSEVGHTNIGAGRVVYQELTRITKSIKDEDFYNNEVLLKAIDNCKKHGSKLHLFGLLSDGGVHSHNTHLYALLELAKREGLEEVYVHCFLDGRDVPPNSGRGFVQQLVEKLRGIGVGQVATVMGRYYSMDRDNRWERVQKAYDAMVLGEGPTCESAVTAVEKSYNEEVMDEFVIPTVITKDGKSTALVEENDSVIFFNFRPDRAREITRTFVDPDFKGFERKKGYLPLYFVCMTQYDAEMPNVSVAFKPQELTNTFGQYISEKGFRQLRIAETEKYAHVTFFFNGGVEAVYKGEDRALIPSPKVATYDLQPEMSAYEVTEEVLKRINSKEYDVIILNYANCDMVGHTGIFDAAVKAVETVDECIAKVVEAVQAQNGVVLITADHGNSDQMIDYETDGPFTAHTTNVVPLIMIGKEGKLAKGRLADIAPTMLDIMELEKPDEMTGESLISE